MNSFTDFATQLHRFEETSSRLTMTEWLSDLYKSLKGEEIRVGSYLMQGELLPAYEALEFQLSNKMIMRALEGVVAQSKSDVVAEKITENLSLFGDEVDANSNSEASLKAVEKLFHQLGDLGQVAFQIREAEHITATKLSVTEVYERLMAIAKYSGEGSQDQKVSGLTQLLLELDPISAKCVVRIILGKMRLGFSTQTLLDALSWAATGSKADRDELELAYQKKADIGQLAAIYLKADSDEERQKQLQAYTVEVGIPVLPALCQRLNTADEVIQKMGAVFVEPKYDGLRVQIHIKKDGFTLQESANGHNRQATNELPKIRTFTRSLEENSHQFPELFPQLKNLNCESCILDAEAIGYDIETGEFLPFQETVTRKRKHGVAEQASQVPLKFLIFDILSLDEKPLIDVKLRERKDLLNKLFKENEVLQRTQFIEADTPETIRAFHTECLEKKLEGVVIKQPDSVYQSGRKGWSWVKMKEEEGSRGKLADTLDCVVMGGYFGKGKRTAFGVGAFLVGVIDAKGAIKTIAKIGTGLSDDQFRELKQRVEPLLSKDQPANYEVHKSLVPDFWTVPGLVVEVAADELTLSPTHTAGLALRFPRLVRFRDDKKWEDSTTQSELDSLQGVSSE